MVGGGRRCPPEVAAELDELWKEVLLQQFHDIIPGSSIAWVHDDAEAAHARVAARLEALIADALAIGCAAASRRSPTPRRTPAAR